MHMNYLVHPDDAIIERNEPFVAVIDADGEFVCNLPGSLNEQQAKEVIHALNLAFDQGHKAGERHRAAAIRKLLEN